MTERARRCSWVHDTLFINRRGDAYACCWSKPGVVGNINDETLEQIYYGERIQKFRQEEIDGTLACAKTCKYLQHPLKDDLTPDYHNNLHYLLISFGHACNIACVMCGQDHKSRLELDSDTVIRNIELPKSLYSVSLYGGEPLVLKSARKYFDHCAAHGVKVSMVTNGTAINKEMANKIALHCSSITVSLNGASREIHERVNVGSRFDKVLKNVGLLVDAKKTLKGEVLIIGHMTIVEQNVHEVAQFINKGRQFGFEGLNFSFDLKVPKFLAKDPALKKQISTEVKAALDGDQTAFQPDERPWVDTTHLHSLGFI